MNDYIVKAIALQDQVRAYAIRSTDTVSEAQRRHDTLPTSSVALGRSMTAGAILGAMMKGDEKLTIKIDGGGPIGTILVDANAKGEVRGYVSYPRTHFEVSESGKLDVKRAVGTNGTLSVSKDVGLSQPFVGQVAIETGEIGDDFTSYIMNSEQTPSSVGVGVLVNEDNTIRAAGGFIIQLLPGTSEETIRFIENRLLQIPSISTMVKEGLTPEKMLEEVLGAENVSVLETMPVQFQCQCSRDRIARAIISLGQQEIQDMIVEDGKAEAQCHFCNEYYLFTKADLEKLLEETK
ncbi:Hsp33 family molecular chaperone HslO [Psychrobacillus lasiicapitis]|uniref:33 kDa chaperonin n=1 Tax=Psychrobacillus lasiicapitis TaxID=1636719 RepID=A0A544SWU6_9BACI|nr:Hsp33 family molecular chaperone HslO [Psychrobacillus lasiicapitis]TQR09611.1 Hsp33 family molecular chaperone HslO [Psychrobacillus lasiicapitis]GGA29030.1 33 kDa chaperonin [Psychrobacillus lasiicapitis]